MEQVSKHKYQVAWFKLSEFIRRGEKERAIGIYKLLMHTIDDSAFAKQLEGDLLLFFADPDAPACYIAAAQLYKKNDKLAQATAIYEHLVAQFPHDINFFRTLISYYTELNHPTRTTLSLTRLLPAIVPVQPAETVHQAIENVCMLLEKTEQAQLYSTFVCALIKHDQVHRDVLDQLIQKTLSLMSTHEQKAFLKQLDALHR